MCPVFSGSSRGKRAHEKRSRAMAGQIPNEKTIDDTIDLMKEGHLYSELPTTYQPYGLIEVGASRLIVAFTSQRKLTELTLLFQEFCYL
jgi:hypothetical protein